MATTSFPEQQGEPQQVLYPQVVSSSSGSVGPFFIVISVLAVITVLSCLLGRFLAGRTTNQVHISYGDHWWWLRRKLCCCCMSDELHLGAKPAVRKSHDIETPCPPPSD